MTIRHLRVFVCVCKHNSITRAAEELFVAQPAVSNTVSEIEKHYNIVLFNRINQRLHLTPEGSALLIKAQEVLASFEEFELQAQNSSSRPLVRIGASLTIGNQQMASLIKGIKEQFKDVDVHLSINQTAFIESKIADGTLDFAFIQGRGSDSSIKSEVVSSNNLIAACGVEYDIPDTVTLKQLCKYDLLLREDDSVSREFLGHMLGARNITVSPVIESVSNQALISAARENLGVTVLPESLLKSHIRKGYLRKINISDCELTRVCSLIYHKNKTFSPIKKEIIDFCFNNYNK